MQAISDFFFFYILFPTAAIAYVVYMWVFICWTIKACIRGSKDKNSAKNKTPDAR